MKKYVRQTLTQSGCSLPRSLDDAFVSGWSNAVACLSVSKPRRFDAISRSRAANIPLARRSSRALAAALVLASVLVVPTPEYVMSATFTLVRAHRHQQHNISDVKSSRTSWPRGQNFVLGLGLGLEELSSASTSLICPQQVLKPFILAS